jgi:hypothetical protein
MLAKRRAANVETPGQGAALPEGCSGKA